METERLIERLAAELKPVRRIAPPASRLALWLLISVPAAGLVVWLSGPRPDLAQRLADPAFLAEEAAALLTALVGIYASLCAGLPDQPDWKVWLPMAAAALWFGVVGQQCLDVFLRLGPNELRVTADGMCFPAIALGGLVPAISIAVMLRRSGRFRTTHACLCGGLGAAALSAAALRLYHVEDAAIMVFVWQLGSVMVFAMVAGMIGRMFADSRAGGFSRIGL